MVFVAVSSDMGLEILFFGHVYQNIYHDLPLQLNLRFVVIYAQFGSWNSSLLIMNSILLVARGFCLESNNFFFFIVCFNYFYGIGGLQYEVIQH